MDPQKFAKILAMAESDHPGEALSALRAARIMLTRAGMSFRDLAGLVQLHSDGPPAVIEVPPQPPQQPPPTNNQGTMLVVEGLRRQVFDLEFQVRDLTRRLDRQKIDLERQQQESIRWRKMAQETAEQLWEMGKSVQKRRYRSEFDERRLAIITHLRDPITARLSDREIARRVGWSAGMVGCWRRRLAIEAKRQQLARIDLRDRYSGRQVLRRFGTERPPPVEAIIPNPYGTKR